MVLNLITCNPCYSQQFCIGFYSVGFLQERFSNCSQQKYIKQLLFKCKVGVCAVVCVKLVSDLLDRFQNKI